MVYLLTYMHLWNQPNVAKWTIHGWYAQCYVYTLGPCFDTHFFANESNENYGAVVLLPLRDGRDGPKKWTNHPCFGITGCFPPSTWWKFGWVFRVQSARTAMAIIANWCNWCMYPGICIVYCICTYPPGCFFRLGIFTYLMVNVV